MATWCPGLIPEIKPWWNRYHTLLIYIPNDQFPISCGCERPKFAIVQLNVDLVARMLC